MVLVPPTIALLRNLDYTASLPVSDRGAVIDRIGRFSHVAREACDFFALGKDLEDFTFVADAPIAAIIALLYCELNSGYCQLIVTTILTIH